MIGNCNAEQLRGALARLGSAVIEPAEKGFTALAPVTPDDLAARNQSALQAGLSTPLMVLRLPQLEANVHELATWSRSHGMLLAADASSTMIPQVISVQLAAGAWAMSVASMAQVRALYQLGIRRILLANEVVDPAALSWLGRARQSDPDLEVACYIDSRDGVDLLRRYLPPGQPMPVLIELGVPGERTGVRDIDSALALARYARGQGLQVCGAAVHEGVLGSNRVPTSVEAVRELCRDVHQLARSLVELVGEPVSPAPGGYPPQSGFRAGRIVCAGSTQFRDVVADALAVAVADGMRVVLRAGDCLGIRCPTGDGRPPGSANPAVEVWASVLSRPEAALALLDLSRRDLPHDCGLPIVLGNWRGRKQVPLAHAEVFELDDQHTFVRLGPGSDVRVGDVLALRPRQPTGALDRWRTVPLLDADNRVLDVARALL